MIFNCEVTMSMIDEFSYQDLIFVVFRWGIRNVCSPLTSTISTSHLLYFYPGHFLDFVVQHFRLVLFVAVFIF